MVELGCCLVSASTNQSKALNSLVQSVRWLKMKEMNCHLLTTALLTRGRGKKRQSERLRRRIPIGTPDSKLKDPPMCTLVDEKRDKI